MSLTSIPITNSSNLISNYQQPIIICQMITCESSMRLKSAEVAQKADINPLRLLKVPISICKLFLRTVGAHLIITGHHHSLLNLINSSSNKLTYWTTSITISSSPKSKQMFNPIKTSPFRNFNSSRSSLSSQLSSLPPTNQSLNHLSTFHTLSPSSNSRLLQTSLPFTNKNSIQLHPSNKVMLLPSMLLNRSLSLCSLNAVNQLWVTEHLRFSRVHILKVLLKTNGY